MNVSTHDVDADADGRRTERRAVQATEILDEAINKLPLGLKVMALRNRTQLIETLSEAGFLAVGMLDTALSHSYLRPNLERLLRRADAPVELSDSIREALKRSRSRSPSAVSEEDELSGEDDRFEPMQHEPKAPKPYKDAGGSMEEQGSAAHTMKLGAPAEPTEPARVR
jgi:hypothetical protein